MSQKIATEIRFCGQIVTQSDLELIRSVVNSCRGLSRTELANTICELLGWERASGRLKRVECLQFLDQLEAEGQVSLPGSQGTGCFGGVRQIGSDCSELCIDPLQARSVQDVAPIVLERVERPDQRKQWRTLIAKYHYLGDKVPFGAHMRYLIWASRPRRQIVGCFQFSSPAWRIKARDQWIGWDDSVRAQNLQKIVNNSRFLILPSIKVPNLASHVLSQVAQLISADWTDTYGVKPVLLETLVDPRHFSGTCYKAGNWIEIGQTSGRGRQDNKHQRHGIAPKTVFVYPLTPYWQRKLRGEDA